jgi:hypothetical protein
MATAVTSRMVKMTAHNQRRNLARHVVMVCHGAYSRRELLANADMAGRRFGAY